MVRAGWYSPYLLRPQPSLSNRPKGTILFSNKLAEVCKSDGIVSISLFPGAPNADIWGHAGSVLRRAKQLLVAATCLAISGGNVTSLADEISPYRIRTNVVGTVSPHIRAGVAQASPQQSPPVENSAPAAASDPLSSAQQQLSAAQDRLTEFSNASLRASTSLYAGTSPEAGQLSGKYLTAWARVTPPHRKALLPALRESVWTWCETRIEDYVYEIRERY